MKICVLSDTHGYQNKIKFNNEINIDTIIHCGDFTTSINQNKEDTIEFLNWFNDLPIKNKILIAGNHEEYLYELYLNNELEDFFKNNFKNIHFLQDSSVIIDGIKFYGTPWTLKYRHWFFMKKNEDELFQQFKNIDRDTNVLISHTPAEGILDYGFGKILGSSSIKYQIENLKELKFHLFGHIHDSYGYRDLKNYTAINSAFLKNHNGFNNLIIFDYFTKEFL